MERKMAWRRAWKHTLFLLSSWIIITILYVLYFRHQESTWHIYTIYAWLIIALPLFVGLFLWEAFRTDDSTEQGNDGNE